MPGRRHNGFDLDYRSSYPGDPGRPQDFYPSTDPVSGYRNGEGRPSENRYQKNDRLTEVPDSSGGHVYSVDHLVTWSVGVEHGVLTHQDGMRQLSKLEQESGIYTMRCTLTVKKSALQMADVHTGDLVEQFPLECIRDPVAVMDKNGSFKNLVLFTVLDQPGNKHSPSEMHIFQVVGQSARELANDMADAVQAFNSKSSRSSKGARPTSTSARRPESYGNLDPVSVQDAINKFEHSNTSHQEPEDVSRGVKPGRELRATRRLVDTEGESEDDVKIGVALLNRCFDDVERFILRLKQSAKALQELTSRKRHSKSRKHGEGMLTLRSKAPSPAEFVECFQKIKLAFNLLARLKSYLHSPNSADLVHFLFTPLSLLVEASNDPRFDINDLVSKVVTPLLNRQTVELLENCLTSKEYEFWMSLGEAWRTPRGKWTYGGQLQEFRPTFNDGWQPSESWLEMFLGNTIANLAAKQAIDRRSREVEEEPAQHFNGASNGRNGHDLTDNRQGTRSSDHLRSPSQEFPSPPSDLPLYTNRSGRTNRTVDSVPGESRNTPWDDYQRSYLRDLQQRNAKIYEVVQDRKGNNSKELTIRKGEIVEVLDDDRNWWKCANINGDQGFVPYTLLKQFENVVEGLPSNDQYLTPRSSNAASAAASPTAPVPLYIPAPPPPPPAYPPPPSIAAQDANWRLDKRNTTTATAKADKQRRVEENAASRRSDDFSLELRNRLSKININGNPSTQNGAGRRLSASLSAQVSAQVFIDQHSSATEVAGWLEKKGFQEHTRRVLAGYTGSELFHLSNEALMGEFGHHEGARLVSQIKLMKTTAGYTLSGSSQLRKILERRKQKADNDEEHNSQGSDNTFEDSEEFASVSMIRSNKQGGGRRY